VSSIIFWLIAFFPLIVDFYPHGESYPFRVERKRYAILYQTFAWATDSVILKAVNPPRFTV
jgi:hypothetical protein